MENTSRIITKAFQASYTATTLFIFGITIDVCYILQLLFSNPTPFAELPTTGKIALALPLFAMMIYAYKKLALIATGGDKIQQLMNIAKETKKENSHDK
ncbi:hypothetical protein GR140_18955 [Pseudomonas putida]|uniref:hypothetical protein n=1 Tax=Pseudomonas putida TaxID=303 RepID=UPI001BB011A1|nr:hypothetical protein [Pseudomonas putida]QUG90745.1 hypothetical protein GR140_18955 [Pseudomonas putida]